MRRTLLIAYREYLENVRTKGFWIGILMMPIVLALVGIVPLIVESTRAPKHYAVIDNSATTLIGINKLINQDDFSKFLADYDADKHTFLPGHLVTIMPELKGLTKEDSQSVVRHVLFQSPLNPKLPRRIQSYLTAEADNVRDWWNSQLPVERARLSRSISSNHYSQSKETLSVEALNLLIKENELFAYFIIPPSPIESSDGAKYISNNLTDQDLQKWFSEYISRYVRNERLASSEVDPLTATWINEPIRFEGTKLGDDGAEQLVDNTDIARQWAPVAFVYFLWISILINTQMLITNTIEEKSNKLIEVLLSSVSPIVLMAGKIIGIAATGLTIITAWLTMAIAFFIGLPALVGIELPIDLSSVLADPGFLASFVVYFLLGYLLYAALLVGLGSLCNNLKEAQNLILPVQMIQMLPILLMVPIGRDPNGTLAQVLSYIPPLTPFVMMNRAAGPPTDTEYLITTLLLIASIAIALWLAAKMFRVGILMTGKRPGILQIIKLLRAPVTGLSRLKATT